MKAAIIGTGNIAREHLGALGELPTVQTVGVCDLSATLAEATADRFDVPAWYTDYREMLERAQPDAVHIATPPPTHYFLAKDCLEAGKHVLCEKPITERYEEFAELKAIAEERGLLLLENHNYMFNGPMQRILDLVASGEFGRVTSVEVQINLDIAGPGSRFTDPNMPHPCLTMSGGAIADFLTHIGYLIYLFTGPHEAIRTVWVKNDADSALPSDEMRALIKGPNAVGIAGFSALAQPDGFWVRVMGTKMQAETNLFEPPRLTLKRLRDGYRPLMTVLDGIEEAIDVSVGALGGLALKLGGGPLTYDGLYELVARMYRSLETGGPTPVPMPQIDHVARLVADFTREENML
jgi:predicted dehydrogenase